MTSKIIKLPIRHRSLSGDAAFEALKEQERETGTRIRLKLSDCELRELLRTIKIGALGDPDAAHKFARWLAGTCDYCSRPILGLREGILYLGDELLRPKHGLTYLPGKARQFWSIRHLCCTNRLWPSGMYRLDTFASSPLSLPWDVRAEIDWRRAVIDASGKAAEEEARRLPKLRVYDLENGTLQEFE